LFVVAVVAVVAVLAMHRITEQLFAPLVFDARRLVDCWTALGRRLDGTWTALALLGQRTVDGRRRCSSSG
jgi:hypothetical protein